MPKNRGASPILGRAQGERPQAGPDTPTLAVGPRALPEALLLPLAQVVPDPGQPRRDWAHDEGAQRLEELAASIKEFGVLQPLLVREDGYLDDGRTRYAIVAGGRRRAAATIAGLEAVPVVVRGGEVGRIRVLQLIENLQRQDLSPLDEARAYQELLDAAGLSAEALAGQLHVSGQHVRERLRLLADQVFADAVQRRQISATAARDIMRLPDDEIARFRVRVLAGERLQSNDIAAARARLDAAGVTNPRHKGGGRRAATPPDRPTVPDPASVPAPPLADDQATLDGAVPSGAAASGVGAADQATLDPLPAAGHDGELTITRQVGSGLAPEGRDNPSARGDETEDGSTDMLGDASTVAGLLLRTLRDEIPTLQHLNELLADRWRDSEWQRLFAENLYVRVRTLLGEDVDARGAP